MTRKKGRGVFANCKIKKGEVIEVAPAIVLSRRETKVIDDLSLSSHCYQWGDKQKALVLGLGCIYNHSYNPNAVYSHRFKQQAIVFKALRNIRPGEEITHNYNGDPKSRAPIRFTKNSWWFVQ
ncbi:MAG: SET domain-containing protein [bacterium]|nr:SET domain-containing protein [bacterium]